MLAFICGFIVLIIVLAIIKGIFTNFWDNLLIVGVILLIIYLMSPTKGNSSEWVFDAYTGPGGSMHNSWFDQKSQPPLTNYYRMRTLCDNERERQNTSPQCWYFFHNTKNWQ